MKRAVAWFAENHVAANLLMALLVVGGLLTMVTLKQEMIPEIDLDIVTVNVAYPGASPSEVEDAICVRVEEALTGLPGVKRLRSTAAEGVGSVTVELLAGEDVSRRLADIRARVDSITGFPGEAERPVVQQAEMGNIVLSITLSGSAGERTLKRMAERIRDEITALPEVSEVSLASVRADEITIEVSEASLRRYGLTIDDVAAAVRRSSVDLPGGAIRARDGEILLRAVGQADTGAGFGDIALVSKRDGTRLRLADVARVVDGFAETDQRSRFDGESALLIQVYRVGDQKALVVSDAVEAYVERVSATLPEGIELTVWQNAADYLEERLDSMFRNARSGFFLVLLVLALFLRFRLALWVSLGIPIAFLGAVAVMPALDQSINWISLLGFIVVLGVVVDDAIVVGENAFTEQQRLGSPLRGAIEGAQSISVPVVFGVATTIAAFAPMLFIPGSMGRITGVLPTIVIACLVFSLVEAMFILPAHLGHGRGVDDSGPGTGFTGRWRTLQGRIAQGLEDFTHQRYKPALERAIEHRYLVLASSLSILLLTLGMLAGGWLRFTFQEPVEGDLIVADLAMAPGTSAEVTARAVAQLESAALRVRDEADADRDLRFGSIFRHRMATVGERPFLSRDMQLPGQGNNSTGGHLGEVQVEMIAPEHRDIGTDEMQRRWREAVGAIPGAVELTFQNSMITAGMPIEVELRGHELDRLRGAAAALRAALADYPGVFDVADSFRRGKQELQFQILPAAEALGLTQQDIARQVRQAFYGEEAQRIQRGREEVKVVVRYPFEERRSLGDVETLRVRARDGSEVPLSSVARLELATGYASIERVDRQRVLTVTADVDKAEANANEIVAHLQAEVLPQIMEAFPGIRAGFEGEQAEQRTFLAAMIRGQVIALLVIYGLLAVPLRSYLQPLLIMSAIPFGLVGAAFGHLLLGYDFSMYSVIGFVALSGVVVNASLVLVDCVNRLRLQGERLADAVRDAGVRRLRAIMLTSLTTFVGLLPMMLEQSMSARFMIPMAIALGFGVLFASLITLFMLPCAYIALEDVTLRWKGQPRTRSAEAPRARDDHTGADVPAPHSEPVVS